MFLLMTLNPVSQNVRLNCFYYSLALYDVSKSRYPNMAISKSSVCELNPPAVLALCLQGLANQKKVGLPAGGREQKCSDITALRPSK